VSIDRYILFIVLARWHMPEFRALAREYAVTVYNGEV